MASRMTTVMAPATLQVLERDRLALERLGHDHAADARAQVLEVVRERQDRHDLGRRGDVELRLAHVARLPDADQHASQGAVVHVEDARPADGRRVDAELVAAEELVVQEGRAQVVRRGHRVQVPGEVEVDVLHRQHLAVAAAGAAALDAEDGPQRRLPDGRRRLARRCGSAPVPGPIVVVVLPSPSGVGVMAVTMISRPFGWSARRSRMSSLTLALYGPYDSSSSGRMPELGRDVGDRPQVRALGDLEAAGHGAGMGCWIRAGQPAAASPTDGVAPDPSRPSGVCLQLGARGAHQVLEEDGVRDGADATRHGCQGAGDRSADARSTSPTISSRPR